MTVRRVRPLIWIDELQPQVDTGQVSLANMVVTDDFSETEVTLIRTRCDANPGRELVISMHKTSNAAQRVRERRQASDRWKGLGIHTRRVPVPNSTGARHDDWTAIVAVRSE